MLRTRIITAVVLLALLLPALFAPSPWPFAALTLMMIGAAGWEWARLNGVAKIGAISFGALVALLCAGVFLVHGVDWHRGRPHHWFWWVIGGLWVLGGAYALRGGPGAWPRLPRAVRLALGLIVLFAAWAALSLAKVIGLNFLLSAMCLVWVADIGAYFAGRAFGRRKLAPAISPGKSWEGVWGGMVGVLLLALLWSMVIDKQFNVDSQSLYAILNRQTWPVTVLALLFLAVMSVVGDLFESLLKRAVGAKDSSQLLPGHGGVLDRVDALLPVLPLALAFSSLQ
ncbi:MAG TPA: phosphatidate cytidylyltransferase [Burkholderiaceae bacterium]